MAPDSGERTQASKVFEEDLGTTIGKFSRDRDRHKRKALWLKLSVSGLGAIATVLLGWDSPGALAHTLKNAALMATALITVLAAYDAFFEPRKLWVRETFVLNSLKDLKREFVMSAAARSLTAEDIVKYSERLRQVLAKSLDEWVKDKQSH